MSLHFLKIISIIFIVTFAGLSIFGFNTFLNEDTANHINLIALGILNFVIAKGVFNKSQFIIGIFNILVGTLAFITAFFSIVF
ncbi:hypothetical protein [Candidatus Epulonipiscium viviparus]|uniref:hypothetical protein n=1 Tax=Candidatus Epulonipiscium viviparus TaxID=420336 RepID=UPI00016C0C3C|nr:hypothetical protein [Candidatus Epulopiscium viviparus]